MSVPAFDLQHFFPWISFMAGLGGSLHCVGMCGGLVTATCDNSKDIVRYQLGRLSGYLLLGALAGFLGSLLKFENHSPLVTVLPGIAIGFLFLFWGIQNIRGQRAELPTPKFMGQFYAYLWRKLVFKNVSLSKSFFVGLISIFLPCGLLYGVILGTMALQHPLTSFLSMLFFWLGTVPSMVMAPQLLQKILRPLKKALPKTYALGLIFLGLFTVSFRVVKFNELRANPGTHASAKHSCH